MFGKGCGIALMVFDRPNTTHITHPHTPTHRHTHCTNTRTNRHMHTHTHTHTHIHTSIAPTHALHRNGHTHTLARVQTHTHIHTHTRSCGLRPWHATRWFFNNWLLNYRVRIPGCFQCSTTGWSLGMLCVCVCVCRSAVYFSLSLFPSLPFLVCGLL